jgi:hypothetical protein
MTTIAIFSLLVGHFIADFVAQTDAKGKSHDLWFLSLHVTVYTLIMMLVVAACGIIGVGAVQPWPVAVFVFITFVCHWVTDYASSRVSSALYQAEKHHDFFVVVGLDQLLHYTQLIFTYQLCFRA